VIVTTRTLSPSPFCSAPTAMLAHPGWLGTDAPSTSEIFADVIATGPSESKLATRNSRSTGVRAGPVTVTSGILPEPLVRKKS